MVHTRPPSRHHWYLFVSRHHGLYPNVTEISAKCLYTAGDSLFQISVYCKLLASQVLLMGPNRWKQLGATLQTGIVTGCIATAGRLWTTLTTILISFLVISISLNHIRSSWRKVICNRCQHEASCHLHATLDTWHQFHLPWCHITATLSSDVYHLLPCGMYTHMLK
jgi:hypothetical protein